MLRLLLTALHLVSAVLFISCGPKYDTRNEMIISVKDQKLLLIRDNTPLKTYPVSTSKFGLGSRNGSRHTPLGKLQIAKKIGDGAPIGAVFKSRRRTGEVIKPNAPGRDPIVTRILWLRGLERHNRNSMRRYIYIHGTPEERNIGKPVSYGCIRMKSRHIIDLYRSVGVGTKVYIIRDSLDTISAAPTSE